MAKEITQETIGRKLRGEHERDAIHIAVIPVIAGEDYLLPGEGIVIVYGTENTVISRDLDYGGAHGIADPFLLAGGADSCIKKGDRFWMFLFPNSITGLRHSYTCPAIDNRPGVKNEHDAWLRGFSEKWNFDYDAMIEAATAEPPTDGQGNLVIARGKDLHKAGELGEDHDLFWFHLEAMTGIKFSGRHRERLCWSCTC